MCLGSLFSKPKAPPAPPPPPPMPSPPPTPTAIDSQTQVQDAGTLRRRRARAGLASTQKTSIFGTGAELSSLGTGSQNLFG